MLNFGDAAKRLGVRSQNFDQLADQLGERYDDPLAEIGELSLHAVTLRTPFVLKDQDPSILAPALITVAKMEEQRQDRLVERRNGQTVFDPCANIAHADFEGRMPRARANVPPDLRWIADHSGCREI